MIDWGLAALPVELVVVDDDELDVVVVPPEEVDDVAFPPLA